MGRAEVMIPKVAGARAAEKAHRDPGGVARRLEHALGGSRV